MHCLIPLVERRRAPHGCAEDASFRSKPDDVSSDGMLVRCSKRMLRGKKHSTGAAVRFRAHGRKRLSHFGTTVRRRHAACTAASGTILGRFRRLTNEPVETG